MADLLYLRLFLEFFKIGLFAVGGGLATLPFLSELSAKTAWFTQEELANMIAVGESTPGPIGVNMATYAGFTTSGPIGSVIATLGLVTPSVIVILIVAGILKRFQDNRFVKGAFTGLRPASAALITSAFIGLVLSNLFRTELFSESGKLADLFNLPNILLAVVTYFAVKKWKKLHPALFLAIGALVGILFKL